MHRHLPRLLSLARTFAFSALVVAVLTYTIFVQTAQAKHQAKHGSQVACRAARNSDLGLVRGLKDYLSTPPRKIDAETEQFLVFLRSNADAVYDGCIRDIH